MSHRSYDALIIGAGIMGCSSAFELASRDLSVAVLEKAAIGSGSTGKSSAIIRQHYSNEVTARMALYSLRVFQRFREVVHTLEGHLYSATSVRFSPDGSLLVSGSRDQTVRVWNTADGSPLATMEGHSGVVTSVVFSADGSLLASGSEDDTAMLWGLGEPGP